MVTLFRNQVVNIGETSTNKDHFNALHLPSENSVKSFSDQLLTIVKLTIDSLNEKMFIKGLSKIENERGIAKFERFLAAHSKTIPDMITFLTKFTGSPIWDDCAPVQ